MGDERGPRAHPRSRGRGLASGMSTADHDHIELRIYVHVIPRGGLACPNDIDQRPAVLQFTRQKRRLFHVKHPHDAADCCSLADAEITEDHVQDIFNIYSPCQSAKRGRGKSELLG